MLYKQLFIDTLTPHFGDGEALSMWKYMQVYLIKNEVSKLQFDNILKSLVDHYPIQYLVNESFFYDSTLYINEHVLIPRPETEELVHLILEENKAQNGLKVIDIGTGSGCIICLLGKHLTNPILHATDVSEEALKVARKNAEGLKLDVNFHRDDFLNSGLRMEEMFDIIVSNPPYIDVLKETEVMSHSTLKHEPKIALFGPSEDFLLFYKLLAKFGLNHLSSSGSLYVEMNALQAEQIISIFENQAYTVSIENDLQGLPRILKASL